MATTTYHITPDGDRWAVKEEGKDKPVSTHNTQKGAIKAARDVANDGDQLVIHRMDGTIRNNITYSSADDSHSGHKDSDSVDLRTRDIMSVGTRVSWSAILAGAVVGFAVYLGLTMLAIAIGVTTADHISNKTFAVSATSIAIISCLASLFIGGFVVSRTTVGENKAEALIYGLLLWAVLFVVPAVFSGAGLGIGYGVLAQRTDEPVSALPSEENMAKGLNLTNEQKAQYKEMRDEAAELAEDVSPATMAWIGFGTMILSMMAAILGSIVGAGPELVVKQLHGKRHVVVEK